MPDAAAPPLRFLPSFEQRVEDEDHYDRALTEKMLGMSRTVLKDTGHVHRSVHAKSHGLLRGELRVLDGLPPQLAQGLYARPGTYPVVMRFSTTPGDILDDNISTPRGLAIKVVGVEGERLPGSEDDRTQNYVLGNSSAFNVRDSREFLGNAAKLGATVDRSQAVKKVISAITQTAEAALELVGQQSTVLTTYAGQAKTHILGDAFYSQAALLHGEYAGKLCVAPVSENLRALSEAKVDLHGRPDGLREAVRAFFATQGAEWEVRVQLCTDLLAMPIEDASAKWSEDESPYVAVARIMVGPQDSWSEARVAAIDDGITFSPWRGLAAHRPLGSVMRARRRAYESSAAFRRENSLHALAEPRSAADLPD